MLEPGRHSLRPLPPIGAHVSAAGGLLNALKKARSIGAEVIQIFPSNPRMWRPASYAPDELVFFAAALERSGLGCYVHAIYLINLASPDPHLRHRSAASLADAFSIAGACAARGVVVHVGSHRGDGFDTALPRVVEAVAEARFAADGYRAVGEGRVPASRACLLVESSAGGGNSLGGDLDEIGGLVEALPGPTGFCLDTAHMFAAGYPLHTAEGLADLVAEFEGRSLLDRLGLVHFNDCATALASHHDRHANLWEGGLGRSGLQRIIAHPAFRNVPFVLEVPGADGHGPDRRNVRRARLMRSAATASASATP